MNHIASYPQIYAIGHRAIAEIFTSPVVVEEKIDGSQFSFGRINGELVCRSKGKDIIPDAPEKMFIQAIEVIKTLDLRDGWIYRAEYLKSPKHNTLAYSRTPERFLIGFDVQTGVEQYLTPLQKWREFARIGLECVPILHEGTVQSMSEFNAFLERDSVLGGCKVEGVVVKNYAVFTQEKKVAIGKYVSEAFKEKHQGEWKKANPSKADFVQVLVGTYKTPARWEKAIQHLRDDGKLEGSPKDIGALMREVPDDIFKDSKDEIKEMLFEHFWPQIRRGVTAGLPEFYKQKIAADVFSNN